jgi:UDP-glucose 4-epimerase
MDLASGHLKALTWMKKTKTAGNSLIDVFNLGTGQGNSVLEMIHAFEKACACKVAYKIGPRRPGDVAQSYCIPTKAQRVLKWKAVKTIQDSVDDMWRWIQHAKKEPYGSCEVEREGFAS